MIDLDAHLVHLRTFIPGSVWLVGSGPGDPSLLTLAAIHAFQSADIVIYDALVSKEVLALVPDRAALEYAGKRGGKYSFDQRDITHRLIELAQAGRRVLRLKGGDPFVFGRGGEEAMALAEARIPFHVVPGITAGIGGLAMAHIPVTTRETNHALILMTGQLAGDHTCEIDWRPWVATGAPIVLYMAMNNLGIIVGGLLAAGMSNDMPVAVVTNASRPDQRVLVTQLGLVEQDVRTKGFEAPAIVAIGHIVALRAGLLCHGVAPDEVA
jgi:uroporphyrin-III C-methyltransferase